MRDVRGREIDERLRQAGAGKVRAGWRGGDGIERGHGGVRE